MGLDLVHCMPDVFIITQLLLEGRTFVCLDSTRSVSKHSSLCKDFSMCMIESCGGMVITKRKEDVPVERGLRRPMSVGRVSVAAFMAVAEGVPSYECHLRCKISRCT